MVSQAPTIYSLQAPKDISLSDIEAELSQIWQSYGIGDANGALPAATRATTFSLVVYEPEETQYLLTASGFYNGPIDGILGPQTIAALREAQKAFGLDRTGKTTPEILARLREEVAKRHSSGATLDNGNSASYSLDAKSPRIADEIALRNPCRIIALISNSWRRRRRKSSSFCLLPNSKAVLKHTHLLRIHHSYRHRCRFGTDRWDDSGIVDWRFTEVSLVEGNTRP
jgi:hypothetical protein